MTYTHKHTRALAHTRTRALARKHTSHFACLISGFALLALLALFAGANLRAASASTDAVPRPEHPRPDQFRANWISLNGQWQFEIDSSGDGEQRGLVSGKNLASKIIVPFCPESKLSGVANIGFMKNVWYRRMFEVPAAMRGNGQRVRLHFGAVDYQTTVWINGSLAGGHTGGDVSFSFDITPLLRDGPNEIVVRAFDDTASGRQPTGKQTHGKSEGCMYTRTTGIWQPVWLEAVGSSFVENFSLVPDPDHSRVLIEVTINPDASLPITTSTAERQLPIQNRKSKIENPLTLTAEAFANGKKVGEESCPAVAWRNNRLVLALSEKKLWEPGAPFLYDLKFTLTSDGKKLDELSSYFGLRSVSIDGRAILINGKRVFQRLILDQGFYPDGIWTAPSDAELRADIERSLAAGYNGARLHQKVFEPRFLYWADKLGYLVWGEYSNWGFNFKPESYANFIDEWTQVLLRDRNHPAIIGWCPSNETGPNAGELQGIIWRQTKAIDPTRPALETSGWTHTIPNPEVLDNHDYDQNPVTFKQRWMNFFAASPAATRAAPLSPVPARYATKRADRGVPFMVSEFGGIGWDTEGGWGYGAGPKTLEEFYTRYAGLVAALLDNPNMFGFCYTQLTDVEQEHNGLYYYDRRPKFDMKRLHDATARPAAYEQTGPTAPQPPRVVKTPAWRVIVGAAADGDMAKPYRYTTTKPPANWNQPGFDDSGKAWRTGKAPFGKGKPGTRTEWKTDDIWLRQEFDFPGGDFDMASIVIHYDDGTEVFVNGQLIWKHTGYVDAYTMFDITAALKSALKPGRNTLAIHTHQATGGQFIDLALLLGQGGN